MHSLYTSWLSVKISSLTKDWLLRNLCQQLTHFLMREPGTAVNMDHYFEKKLWKFSFYLMFYLLQLEFQVKNCFFGFLLRRCTGTLSNAFNSGRHNFFQYNLRTFCLNFKVVSPHTSLSFVIIIFDFICLLYLIFFRDFSVNVKDAVPNLWGKNKELVLPKIIFWGFYRVKKHFSPFNT